MTTLAISSRQPPLAQITGTRIARSGLEFRRARPELTTCKNCSMPAVQYRETAAARSHRRLDVRKRLRLATARRYALRLVGGALLVGAAPPAAAQQAAETHKLDTVYVTGSNVPRTDIETALPIQVLTREDIERRGAINAAELMSQISANLTGTADAIFIGNGRPGMSSANLRGLGEGSTLVLLNGRRVANYATTGTAVNLNFIPVTAIDRVEILKDGASAIYGADAMAGVINFILRKDYQGVLLSAYGTATQHGGGNQQQATLTAGYGDLSADRFNVFVTVNYQNNEALPARDRPFSSTAYRPDENVDNRRDRDATFPANIRIDQGNRTIFLNPSFATGCMPPYSVPVSGTQMCGYNHLAFVNLLPPVERTNVFAGATWQVAPDHQLFAQSLYSYDRYDRVRNVILAFRNTLQGQPLRYPEGGPFYPTEFAAANGLSGALEVYYRPFSLGPATDLIRTEAQHLVAGAEGLIGGWNYNAAFIYSQNTVKNWGTGNLSARRLMDAMATGLLNPFGASGPEGEALLASATWSGDAFRDKAITSSFEAKASKEIYNLPTGALALALGAEARREELDIIWSPEARSGDILNLPTGPSTRGDRTVEAVFAELNIPIATGLEAQLAVRYDHYSDFGGTTNPKTAVRWQPNKAWLVRGSYGTGLRAPTLPDLWTPVSSRNTIPFSDPRRCDNQDCVQAYSAIFGGNPDLQAEESRQWNLGIVWEPVAGFSLGVDYWTINKKKTIGALSDDQIFTNFDMLESTNIVRGPVDTPTLPGPIVQVIETSQNLGELWTSGVDVDLNLRGPVTSFGRFGFNLNGTYVDKWQQQLDAVHYVAAVGSSVVGAIPRWRHYATLYWNFGPWSATLAQTYSSGYTEINPQPPNNERKVGGYDIWNVQGTYTGFKNTTVTMGIKNLFDREPPFSNQTSQGLVMFDPRYADPRGRTFYAQVAVSFK
jgi:iron complex outermembrane receptor protein